MASPKDKEEGFGLRELFLLGLGILATMEEETKKRVDFLVKKGAEKEARSREYLKDLKEKEEIRGFEARLEKNLRKLVEMAGLASKEDIRRLERRVSELALKLEEKGGA